MEILTKYLNILLILVAVYMGLKQGWAMTSGKAEMLDLFGKWNLGKSAVMAIGIVTMLSAVGVGISRGTSSAIRRRRASSKAVASSIFSSSASRKAAAPWTTRGSQSLSTRKERLRWGP